ncbi:hypothetical protein HMPREF0290_0833, partial [Corynebacterium efficiens YS-314]
DSTLLATRSQKLTDALFCLTAWQPRGCLAGVLINLPMVHLSAKSPARSAFSTTSPPPATPT